MIATKLEREIRFVLVNYKHGILSMGEASNKIMKMTGLQKAFVTACCSDDLHNECSGRVVTNPEDGWHHSKYTPCTCWCHERKT
jgi:hypothetical protein